MSETPEFSELREKLRVRTALPTLPGIVTKLSKMVSEPTVSANQIGNVIAKDQILAAKLLKLVNSAFYGFPGRISTVSNAVVLLGINVIRSLVLSASIFETMEKSLIGLWEHSLGCAAISNVIAKRIGLPEPEEISTAGLLHDIGKVVIKENLEGHFAVLQDTVAAEDISLYDAETKMLGIDHAEVAKRLCRNWNLPDRLAQAITYHHQPEKSSSLREAAVVHVADILVRARGFGSGGDKWVPSLNHRAWAALGIKEDDLSSIIMEAEEALLELKGFSFEIQTLGEKCQPTAER